MKPSNLVGMLNDLNRRICTFDINKLINSVKDGTVDPERARRFVDNIYNLEEDLIIIDCNKDRK